MRNRSTIWLFAVLVFVLPLAGYAVMNWYENRMRVLPILGPVTDSAGSRMEHTISNFVMEDQDGQTVTTADWKNRIIVADFFFTHCPAVCPN